MEEFETAYFSRVNCSGRPTQLRLSKICGLTHEISFWKEVHLILGRESGLQYLCLFSFTHSSISAIGFPVMGM